MVRDRSQKTIFNIGFMLYWTKEHFTVSQALQVIRRTKRRVYMFVDYNNYKVTSSWYPKEIQEITDKQYHIEKF